MKPSKISELLEKINRLAADTDLSKLSQLEIDLLKQHLRDLYAEVDATRNTVNQATNNRRTINPNENVLLNESVVKKEPMEKEPMVTAPIKREKTEAKEVIAKSSINESVQNVSSLNEKVKAPVKEVHKKLSTKPLKDLIDLNKKFILLNELFKGNAESFSAAIHHIDSAEDFATAEAFIKTELHTNYFWDESSQSVRMFMKLVKQKFGAE